MITQSKSVATVVAAIGIAIGIALGVASCEDTPTTIRVCAEACRGSSRDFVGHDEIGHAGAGTSDKHCRCAESTAPAVSAVDGGQK